MRTARFSACCLGILIAGSAAAGDAEWTSAGPLGGGVFEMKFHPAQPATAYATTRGAVYKTYDAGASWERVSDGLVASSVYPLPLALDRELPDTLYTFDSSLRLYRTDDGGLSWQILDHDLPSDFLFYVISDVAGESGSLFIGGESQVASGEPQLFKSSDGGTTFSRIGVGLPDDAQIATITIDPLDANIVYVGLGGSNPATNQASLFRSVDGGANFSPSLNLFGPPVALGYQPAVQDLSFIPGNGGSGPLFAVVDYQIHHSVDGGANWTGPHGPAAVITAHPSDPLKAYFGRADGAFVWFAPTPSPSFFPYNDGFTPNISYTSVPGNVPIRAAVSRLVPQPGYPAPGTSLFATTDGSGVFVREQGAAAWLPSTGNPPGVGVRALAIHPHPSLSAPTGSDVLFAGHSGYAVTSPGLYRSTDQALSWAPFNTGIRANELQVLRIDPSTLGGNIANTVLYAGGSNAGVEAGYAGAGLFRSVNNGQNWLSIDGDLPVDGNGKANIGLIRDVVLDPRSCPAPPATGPCTTGGLQTIYALAEGREIVSGRAPFGLTGIQYANRIVRTDDLGATWIALDGGGSGLPASSANADLSQRITPTALIVDPNDSDVLYLGTEALYDDYNTGDAIVPADLASGVFKSNDAGTTWTHQASNGLPTKAGFTNTQLDVVALLIDPNNSDILWAALTDLRSTGFSTIYRSDDAGDTWFQEDDGINGSVELRALAFDPQDSNILYAAAGGYESNPGAIYRGVWNPGSNTIVWLSISIGLPAESAYTIAVDPFNPNQLHAGTDIGVVSITRLPDGDGDGVPDATENQAPDVPGGIVGPGDGNGDFIPDAAQKEVGSTGVIFRGVGSSFVTTDVVSGSGSSECANGTAQAVDVELVDPAALGLDAVPDSADLFFAHSLGSNSFEVVGCSSASIRIRYHGAMFSSPLWTFRTFAPLIPGDEDNLGWYDFSANATRIGIDTWQVNLTAGGFGSYRPEADSIRFVGGPACFNPILFSDGLETDPIVFPPCPE